MSQNILEKYINLLEKLPDDNLSTTREASKILLANILEDDSLLSEKEKKSKEISNDNEYKKLEYLSNLTREDFYFLYNAFDLGKTYYSDKDSLNYDINRLGGENKLVQSNLSHIKKTFRPKAVAIDQLMGKQDWLVIKSLKSYIQRFM